MALIRNTSCQIPEEKPVLTPVPGADDRSGRLGWPFFPRCQGSGKGAECTVSPSSDHSFNHIIETLEEAGLTARGQPGSRQSCTQQRHLGGWGKGHTISLAHSVTQLPADTFTLWRHCGLGKNHLLPKQNKRRKRQKKQFPGRECLDRPQQMGQHLQWPLSPTPACAKGCSVEELQGPLIIRLHRYGMEVHQNALEWDTSQGLRPPSPDGFSRYGARFTPQYPPCHAG